MARVAPIITLEELKKHMEKSCIHGGYLKSTEKMQKDLSKVEFDRENFELGLNDYLPEDLGPAVLKNNLPVYWGWGGGDWEYPVFFISYWDGKSIRCYIPKEGNTYNKDTKVAFGNAEDEEEMDVKREDKALMEEDIVNRIKIV